ncbi:MAG: replication initiation factor [Propionivibrio sp.]|nr:replication initiation factor [Propionivibrio sp.]
MDMKINRKLSGSTSQPAPQTTAPSLASDRCGASRADGGQEGAEPGRKDATPSNTASYNCNIPYFKALRWGVDSLYVSYPGELLPDVLDRLKVLKALAQSQEPGLPSQAQYRVGSHIFEVKDKGAQIFPYVLEDGAFRIQLARPSKTVPMAYVKVSSAYLAHVGPVEAEKALHALLSELGTIKESANVSRIDLFVDFVTSECIEWDRHAWVTRAAAVNAYAVNETFSGWTVGQGGAMSARLYNKLLEIQKSGKDYLLDLWAAVGWHPGEPVWRLEFQVKRDVLTQKGLCKLDQVLSNLNGLWSYATTEWLRLTLPNEDDKTRSRWPVHPLWGYLSSVDWETNGGPLFRRFTPQRIPDNAKLFNLAFSNITAFMAREGITDFYDGQDAFMAALYDFHADKAHFLGLPFDDYVSEKVAIKARQFNTILNNPDLEAERQALELKKAANAYRKAADGE